MYRVMIKEHNQDCSPAGKLAEVEVHFSGPAAGILEGLKLIGFAVWEKRSPNGSRNVTFPARTYSVNGDRRSFALLRPIEDQDAQIRMRDAILTAWTEHEDAARAATASSYYATNAPAVVPPVTDAQQATEDDNADLMRSANLPDPFTPYANEHERQAAALAASRQPGGVALTDLMPGGRYGAPKTPAVQRTILATPARSASFEF